MKEGPFAGEQKLFLLRRQAVMEFGIPDELRKFADECLA